MLGSEGRHVGAKLGQALSAEPTQDEGIRCIELGAFDGLAIALDADDLSLAAEPSFHAATDAAVEVEDGVAGVGCEVLLGKIEGLRVERRDELLEHARSVPLPEIVLHA